MSSEKKCNKLKVLFGLSSMFLVTFSIFSGGTLIEESNNITPESESPYYESTRETMNDKSVLSTIKTSIKAEKYVENNFSSFVEEINKSDYIDDIVPIAEEEAIDEEEAAVDICEDDNVCHDNDDIELKATSIEYSNSIYIIEEKIYGVYLDFNDDNGYAIISGDYVIYDLQVIGDLEILRDGRDLFYSTIDGFVYFDEDNECQKLFNKKMNDDNLCSSTIIYPGQAKAGDGQIDSDYISEYVAARYPNYTYDSCNVDLSSSFECTEQFDTSFYIKTSCDENGNSNSKSRTSSEGNCVLNAIFNVMRDWCKHSKIGNIYYNLTSNITNSILNDPLYEMYGKGTVISKVNSETNETEYYKWSTNIPGCLVKMHNLYINVRSYAVSEYGYTPESGLYFSDVSDMIEYVASNYYGLKVKTKTKSTISSAISALDDGEAVCMCIQGGQTYSNHAVALMGYQKYTYTSTSGLLSSKKTAYFYQIADGWNENPVYFDPNTEYEPTLNFAMLK